MTTGEFRDPFLAALATVDLIHHPQRLVQFLGGLMHPGDLYMAASSIMCGI
jgi:hypothetical protein